MLRSERNHDRVVGGRGLQLEIERSAKTFAQRESPGAIDSIAKWRMQDQLHSAGFVKETFHHQGLLRRNCAERAISVCEVIGDLFRGLWSASAFRGEPFPGSLSASPDSFSISIRKSDTALTVPTCAPGLRRAKMEFPAAGLWHLRRERHRS